MKRIISLALAIGLIALSLTGCSSKREAFNVNLEKFVTLADYKNITVDRTSTEYSDNYNYIFENMVYSYNAYEKLTTGTVENGDTVNIDYVGKIDGEEFDGGSATGTNLVIGSGSFIDGFESGLVGKEVGSTVDLPLTFSTEYDASVAGKDVVFTVKINYIQELPEVNDALAIQLGFATSDELKANLDNETIKSCIANNLVNNSTVNKYPDDDKAAIDEQYNTALTQLTSAASNYGYDVDKFIQAYYGVTTAQYKSSFYMQNLEYPMIMYLVLDTEKLNVTEDDINAKVNEIATQSGTTVAQVKENYDSRTLEFYTVEEKVLNQLSNIVTAK